MRFIAPLGFIAACLVLTAAAKKCERTSDCGSSDKFLCFKGKCAKTCVPDPNRDTCKHSKKCGFFRVRGTESTPAGNFCIDPKFCCRKNGVHIVSDTEHWEVGGCYHNGECPDSPNPKFAKPIGEEKP